MSDDPKVGTAYLVNMVPDTLGFALRLNLSRSAYQKTYLSGLQALRRVLEPGMQITGTDLVRMTRQPALDRINKRLQEGTKR